jgi:hypothetical protein
MDFLRSSQRPTPTSAQNIAEKISVGLRIGAVSQDVRPVDHAGILLPPERLQNFERKARPLTDLT